MAESIVVKPRSRVTFKSLLYKSLTCDVKSCYRFDFWLIGSSVGAITTSSVLLQKSFIKTVSNVLFLEFTCLAPDNSVIGYKFINLFGSLSSLVLHG